jgi:hypothetical protein
MHDKTSAPPSAVTRAASLVPRALRRYLSLDDFEITARRRLPKLLYQYIAGAAETDAALADNRAAFEEYGFVPRVLNDVSGREQATELFGKTYAAPFGIPPMGSAALCAYRGDLVLARAAAAMNVPMMRASSRWSTASLPPATTPLSSPRTCRFLPTARTTSATVFRFPSPSRRASPGTSQRIRTGCFATGREPWRTTACRISRTWM